MKRSSAVGFVAIALLIFACGGNDPPTGPTTGLLTVTMITYGEDAPSGYTVVLDGSTSRSVDANGSTTFTNVSEGLHEVGIVGIPENCTTGGDDTVGKMVTAGGEAHLAMTVMCDPLVGSVEVSVNSSGEDIPVDYTVVLAGETIQTVAANGSVTFTDVSVGTHEVELTDLPANCSVTGDNPVIVEVTFDAQTSAAMQVQCVTQAGAIEFVVTSTGDDIPPDFQLIVDGGTSLAVSANGSLIITGLTPGDHTLELTEVPQNCSVTGDNPITVAVGADEMTTVTASVECAAVGGSLQVSVTTTGSNVPPEYIVIVDGRDSLEVAANGSVTFTGLDEGEHEVTLAQIPQNCTVTGANPASATVVGGTVAEVAMEVVCAPTGNLLIRFQTDGFDLDPDGYEVAVNGGSPQTATVNGVVAFLGLAAGEHLITMTEVRGNCEVQGGMSRAVDVIAGQVTEETITVVCDWNSRIAFSGTPAGDAHIYVVKPDGSGLTQLTFAGGDWRPAWSPDGTRIAFESGRDGDLEIYVMNADGSSVENLTRSPGSGDSYPVWSPDGSQIAFTSNRDGEADVFVMNADGSAQTNLTNHSSGDYQHDWSPDGTRIAFRRDLDIVVMNADGSAQTNLTNNPSSAFRDFRPHWSPDGTRIAYWGNDGGNYEAFVMNADGSGVVNISNDPSDDRGSAWSPSGDKIAYESSREGNVDIYLAFPDGTDLGNVTNHPAGDSEPAWSPDGSRIVFVSDRLGGGLYVEDLAGPGGTDPTRITSAPGVYSDPDWSPELF